MLELAVPVHPEGCSPGARELGNRVLVLFVPLWSPEFRPIKRCWQLLVPIRDVGAWRRWRPPRPVEQGLSQEDIHLAIVSKNSYIWFWVLQGA